MSGTETGCAYFKNLLSNSKIETVLAVTGSDKPSGRNRRIKRGPLAEYSERYNVKLLQTDKINSEESVEKLKSFEADIAVVVDYGSILSDKVLKIFPDGAYNIHYSILPDLRGPEPVRWALLNGYSSTGVTLMKMDECIDTGGVVSISRIEVKETDNYTSLKERLTGNGIGLLNSFIDEMYINGKVPVKTQEDSPQRKYAGKFDKEILHIDWDMPASEIVNLIKAFSYTPGCYFILKEKLLRVKVLEAHLVDKYAGKPGEIAEVGKKIITVATSKACLGITVLQPAGKRIMKASDFLAGYSLKTGMILS